jgi:hypothetical protein
MHGITILISSGFAAALRQRPFFSQWCILDGGFPGSSQHVSMLYVTK